MVRVTWPVCTDFQWRNDSANDDVCVTFEYELKTQRHVRFYRILLPRADSTARNS